MNNNNNNSNSSSNVTRLHVLNTSPPRRLSI